MAAVRFLSAARTCCRSMHSNPRVWNVYLSGEIHSDWREVIKKGILARQLPVEFTFPNLSHEDSDDCGECQSIRLMSAVQSHTQ